MTIIEYVTNYPIYSTFCGLSLLYILWGIFYWIPKEAGIFDECPNNSKKPDDKRRDEIEDDFTKWKPTLNIPAHIEPKEPSFKNNKKVVLFYN